MIEKIKERLIHFFDEPDWMLNKNVFAAVLFIPVILILSVGLFTYSKINSLEALSEEIRYAERLLKGLKKVLVVDHSNQDENYVENVLAELNFLSLDRMKLATICSEVGDENLYPGIKERLFYLESGENKMRFYFEKENEALKWGLHHPIEMNCKDIRRVISLVEGKQVGEFYPNPKRPNIHFTELNIKKAGKDSSSVYIVDMKMLQKR